MKNIESDFGFVSLEDDIHVAKRTDMGQVCDILGNAFTNDPVFNWICGNSEIYSSIFRLEAESLYKHHGQVYINAEGTGSALWLPSGVPARLHIHWRISDVGWKLFRGGGLRSMKRALLADHILLKQRKQHEPHFYLHAIGANPDYQGQGIGSALLKKGLIACDEHGAEAYLESTNEKNIPLYERFGFEIIGEVSLPEDGPKIWFMKRKAT